MGRLIDLKARGAMPDRVSEDLEAAAMDEAAPLAMGNMAVEAVGLDWAEAGFGLGSSMD